MDCYLILEKSLDEGPQNVETKGGNWDSYYHDDGPLFDIDCYFDGDDNDDTGVDWYLNEVETNLKGIGSVGVVLISNGVDGE